MKIVLKNSTFLKAGSNNFTGENGKAVEYRQVSLLLEDGEYIKIPVSSKEVVLPTVASGTKGTATLELSGYKETAKVKFAQFSVDK